MGDDRRSFLRRAGWGLACLAGAGSATELAGAFLRTEEETGGGKRLGMVVDLVACAREEGCTKCVEACNAVHNVPSLRDPGHAVKWIWKERFPDAFPDQEAENVLETVTEKPAVVLCNHCDNPPCARVCPTEATWKRPDGIVMMDWHRCIGCRYCMAACPYGSRSFNWVDPRPGLARPSPDYPTRTKGVVEKCTFCDERVDAGEPPACVAACPARAMAFGDLSDPKSEVRRLLRSRFALRRKAALGTRPSVYYLV